MKLKHKHYNMTARVIDYCANGSLKVMFTNHTARTAKQRREKVYIITKFERDQWEEVKPEERNMDGWINDALIENYNR